MATQAKKSYSEGKTSVMCVSVPHAPAPGFIINNIWGVIGKFGKFGRETRTLLERRTLEVDFYTKKTRQKRHLLLVLASGKNETTYIFICHPGHKALSKALREFFKEFGLKLKEEVSP